MERGKRPARRPALEALEGRLLLNGDGLDKLINEQDLRRGLLQRTNNVALTDRRISYTTPDRTRVNLTLYGLGTLAGSSVAPDGTLSVVYDRTDASSRLIATTFGGTRRAPLASIRDADTQPGSPSGVGANLIDQVNLANFDLLPGGFINLAGGVNRLSLRSAGADSSIYLREQPDDPATNVGANGRQTTYSGGELVTVVEEFQVGPGEFEFFLEEPDDPNADLPTGVTVQIREINGLATAPTIQPAQVFGYDPAASQIVRFDTGTGLPIQTIPLPGAGSAATGLTVGRSGARQVVLASTGTTVRAFDAITGLPAGQFASAAPIAGLGSTDTRTVAILAAPGAPAQAQVINVAASLATGLLVPAGPAFTPPRELFLLGGLTGVGGSVNVFATAAAHFDTFQPDQFQSGIETINANTTILSESARTQLTALGNVDPANPPAPQALGSLELLVGRLTGRVVDGQNVVDLLSPRTLARQGTLNLAYPTALSGLSESFHPELEGAAIVDVRGDLLLFSSRRVRGLALNVAGTLNTLSIDRAEESSVVGFPVGHVDIASRRNVTITSTARSVDSRGMVVIDPNLRPLAPLDPPVR